MQAQRFHSIVRFSSPESISGINIIAPASGRIAVIEDSDQNRLGQGVKINLESQSIISPINGQVVDVSPAHGRVLLRAKNKLLFLLQLPQEYSDFHGQGLRLTVKVGQAITKGMVILELDLFKVKLNLQPLPLYVSVINTDAFRRIEVPYKYVEKGQDTLFSLVPNQKKK